VIWWCQVPAVSMATGVADSWLYLFVLLVAARLAAAPVFMAVLLTLASAYVSGTVTSHASGRIVVLSGRLLSCRSRPWTSV